MNILHISTPKTWRGGEQQLAYLAEALPANEVAQYFVCASGGATEAFCIENDWASFGINTGITAMLANASLVKRICRNFEIDIIHTHDSKAHTIAFIAAKLGNKTPVVISRRVDFPVGKSWLSRKKYNDPSVKVIICVSKAIMEITGKSILNKSVLKLVYDGIDTDIEIPSSIPDLKAMFGFPEHSVVIGNVAALAPHKDYFTWLDTAAILKQKHPRLRFLIIGDGALKSEIKAYIHKKELENEVVMTGFREDARELMRALDIFMMTSETEGLGSSLLDAFVRKVPVVATDAGGIPEIVTHEKTGLLAPVKNPESIATQAERLLNDDHLRNTLIENARRSAGNFDKSVMATQTYEIYKTIR